MSKEKRVTAIQHLINRINQEKKTEIIYIDTVLKMLEASKKLEEIIIKESYIEGSYRTITATDYFEQTFKE